MKDNSQELLPIVDEQGRQIATATRGECHGGSMLLHPVVHLHVLDPQGRLYLQLRPKWKDIQPGRWDTAVGGHVDPGETILDALRREAREELGIEGFTPTALTPYVFQSDRERELVNPFLTIWDGPIRPTAELDGGRFWPLAEIHAALQSITENQSLLQSHVITQSHPQPHVVTQSLLQSHVITQSHPQSSGDFPFTPNFAQEFLRFAHAFHDSING